MRIIRSNQRGHVKQGWLESFHSFSFADFYNPSQMGFESLRVINDDRIAAQNGFGFHPHKDMEILTFMLEGEIEHKDSMGNHGIITRGEVQKMSAGTGVVHSEINQSNDLTHLLQIWILPKFRGIKPEYQQIKFNLEDQKLNLIAKPYENKKEEIITFHQDINLYYGNFNDFKLEHNTNSHSLYLHVIKGEVLVNEQSLTTGDAIMFDKSEIEKLNIQATGELLLFEFLK
jgi:quercetin 2,3-dioxygenase